MGLRYQVKQSCKWTNIIIFYSYKIKVKIISCTYIIIYFVFCIICELETISMVYLLNVYEYGTFMQIVVNIFKGCVALSRWAILTQYKEQRYQTFKKNVYNVLN